MQAVLDPTTTELPGHWAVEAADLATIAAETSAAHDRAGDFVHETCALLRERGLTSMLVPAELGGGGASYAETCEALTALAHGDPATALTLSMHTHLVAAQVWRHKHGLPAPVLTRVANERLLLISTGASDWVDSHGTATKVDGGYRVSARKGPASGAPAGDVLVSSARTDGADGPQVIHFSVPFSAPGMSIEETWDTMGMRATGSHTVVLDDVFVPDAAVSLVRPAGQWHPIWNTVVGVAMPLIMAVYVGVAEAAADRAIVLGATRRDTNVVAPVLGRMLNRLNAARDAVSAMIALADDLQFESTTKLAGEILTRKTNAADAVIDTVRLAMEAAGGAGYTRAAGIEQLYRDAHGALLHPLPAAKQELFNGRLALGLDPITG